MSDSDSDSEVFSLTRKCANCKNYKDTRQIKLCDFCFKSLCNQCLYLHILKIEDKHYMEWLNILSYDELKLWQNNNPQYEKSFCLSCES